MTIYTDSIGNKFVGYDGQYANTLSGSNLFDSTNSAYIRNLIEDFSGNIVEDESDAKGIVWNVDNIQPNATFESTGGFSNLGDGDYGFSFRSFSTTPVKLLGISASELSQNNIYSQIDDVKNDAFGFYNSNINTATFAVAEMSSKNDFGIFGWDDESNYLFLWVGATLGNPNISIPQSRAAIYIGKRNGTLVDQKSFGVKQADSTTRRLHLSTQAQANHAIDCGTDTAKLFLIEDDGAGNQAGDIGYCPNLYLSKNPNLVTGQFVELDQLTADDGGSNHAVVVGDWGDAGKILMRQYDGVN